MKRAGGKKTKPSKSAKEPKALSGELIISCYRSLGKKAKCAPTSATSDDEIVAIYSAVAKAFSEAAKQRGERIAPENINAIAWQFMRVKEQFGDAFLVEHLEYEIEKYMLEGLRDEYHEELTIVGS